MRANHRYMGKYEVSVGYWRTFVEATDYTTDAENNSGGEQGCFSLQDKKWGWQEGRYWDEVGFKQSAAQPVACVSHDDVVAFIAWLNPMSGKTYRLPTEAEWEYGARAGSSAMRYWGDGEKAACKYANVADKGQSWNHFFPCADGYKYSSPIGSSKSNAFGLYDMLGNVWEWCSDWYDADYYSSSARKNPQGASSGSYRVVRGGSWSYYPRYVRSAVPAASVPRVGAQKNFHKLNVRSNKRYVYLREAEWDLIARDWGKRILPRSEAQLSGCIKVVGWLRHDTF